MYIYIYIYSNLTFIIFYVVFESTLLNYANPCRNWTLQRFARVAEKKECNGKNNNLTIARIRNQVLGLSRRYSTD